MIRIVVIGALAVIAAGAAAMLAPRLIKRAEPPVSAIIARFPEGWDTAPVVEYRKPLRWPSGVPQLSADDFVAAVTALERLHPPQRPPQPADAVFSDAQIASIKDRLRLTPEQELYWQPVEDSLRQVVWNRGGGRARLETMSLARFQEAARPFLETLSARQRSEIQALAAIIGLRIDLSSSH
jgi:hypothetical protein